MKISISFQWPRWIDIEISIPRLGLYAPGVLPESFEAVETWADAEDE
jgi:hypothetical protein